VAKPSFRTLAGRWFIGNNPTGQPVSSHDLIILLFDEAEILLEFAAKVAGKWAEIGVIVGFTAVGAAGLAADWPTAEIPGEITRFDRSCRADDQEMHHHQAHSRRDADTNVVVDPRRHRLGDCCEHNGRPPAEKCREKWHG